MEFDKDGFRRWLELEKRLSQRSINDVVSRLKRVSSLIDPLKPESAPELSFLLSQSLQFRACDHCVRSQLKRAATLYREHMGIAADSKAKSESK